MHTFLKILYINTLHPSSWCLFFFVFLITSCEDNTNLPSNPTEVAIRVPTHELLIPSTATAEAQAQMQQVNDWHDILENAPEAQQDSILLDLNAVAESWNSQADIPAIFKARAKRLQGFILANEDDFEASNHLYLEAITALEKESKTTTGYYYELSYNNNLIANNYFESFNYPMAEHYFRTSLHINLSSGLYIEAMKDYTSLNGIYDLKGDIAQADRLVDSAYQLSQRYGDYLTNRNDSISLLGIAHRKASSAGRSAQLALYGAADKEKYAAKIEEMLAYYHEAGFAAMDPGVLDNSYYLMSWYMAATNYSHLDRDNQRLADTARYYAQKLLELDIDPIYRIISYNVLADLDALTDTDLATKSVQLANETMQLYIDQANGIDNLPPIVQMLYVGSQVLSAKILERQALENQSPNQLLKAIDIAEESITRLEKITSTPSVGSGDNAFVDHYLLYNIISSIYLSQYEQKKQVSDLEKAFINGARNSTLMLDNSFSSAQLASEALTVETIQAQLLDERKAILTWQKSYDKLHLYVLRQDDLSVHTIPYNTNLVQLLEQATKSLEKKEDDDRIPLYELYTVLLKATTDQLKKEGVDQLILIDNPFTKDLTIEHMPTKLEENKSWGQHNLILDDFLVSYAYSIEHLLVAQKANQVRKQSSIISSNWMSFSNINKIGQGELPYLYDLGPAIQKRFDANLSSESQHQYNTPKTALLEQLSQARIGQVITHGKTEENREDLFFLDVSINGTLPEGNIYPSDIYQREIDLDLLLLINCNSGNERNTTSFFGRQSIARAFIYAGCSSIITGLDELPDKATAQIITYFYENWINDGQTVAEALHNAKKQYRLDEPDIHPFFWSQLVVQGLPTVRF